MASNIGKNLTLSIFGESHGDGIGVVIDGVPAGYNIDLQTLGAFMQRRAPGKDKCSTPRKEADAPKILSGLLDGSTCGTPIAIVIENTNTRSGDYEKTASLLRPGHADFTGQVRYKGFGDIRGGGHFSGRLTAPLVAAGGIAKQILAQKGVVVGAHIKSIYDVSDIDMNPVTISAEQLDAVMAKPFAVFDDRQGQRMQAAIEQARLEKDSVGGVVECFALGLPAGIGSPMFRGIENVVASILFGIPALKGVEFGNGFDAAKLRGSQNNDPFVVKDGAITTTTNHHGGSLGGISSGMPLVVRAAFKPTPSIALAQQTVDMRTLDSATLSIQGRHDPCVVPRAVPCVEAAVACAMLDLMLDDTDF